MQHRNLQSATPKLVHKNLFCFLHSCPVQTLRFHDATLFSFFHLLHREPFYEFWVHLVHNLWAGYLSRYSNWLRVGRSGDWIPVRVKFSTPVQTGPGAHPASFTMGTGSFPGVKSSRSMTLTPHHLLVPCPRKSRAIPLLPLWAVQPVQSLDACTRVHFYLFTFCTQLYLSLPVFCVALVLVLLVSELVIWCPLFLIFCPCWLCHFLSTL